MAWEEINETFVNPYNFISLGDACLRSTSSQEIFTQSELLTGWIQCTLTTRTPIFIPHSSNNNAFHLQDKEVKPIKSYDFFSYDNIVEQDRLNRYSEPVIPGSEIRGMIRSAYESVTASCLSSINKDQVLYKRTSVPGQPGRLIREDGKWYIQPCTKAGINISHGNWDRNEPFSLCEYQEGQKVYVQLGPRYKQKPYMYQIVQKIQPIEPKPKGNYQEGFLHKGEPFERKHHESVFIPKQVPKILIDEMTIERLKENIKFYRDETINIHKRNGYQSYTDIQHYQSYIAITASQELDNCKIPQDLRDKLSLSNPNVEIQKKSEKWHIRDQNNTFIIKREQNKLNIYKQSKHKGYQDVSDLDGVLIYYSEHGSVYYLSPANISREVFAHSLNKIVGNFAPCEDSKELCSCCALFGMVGENSSLASRLRFTDGMIQDKKINSKDYYMEEGILQELASPKLSATEFYLQKPLGADIWNYDYAGRWDRDTPFSDISYSPHIRGRKFYWHQDISKLPYTASEEATDRNVKIRPLEKNIVFSFKIYFNSITKAELQKLCWVLNPGEHNCHKLGMGKPLGLGSVKIEIKEIRIRKISLQEKNIQYELENYFLPTNPPSQEELAQFLGCKPTILAEFLAITDWNQKPNKVSYPQATDKNGKVAIYYWFVANKQIPPAKGTSPILHQTLPSIIEKEIRKYREQ